MEAILEKTTKEDQRIARSSIPRLNETSQRIINSVGNSAKIKIDDEEGYLNIPKKTLALLVNILSNMAEGKSITLIPSDTELNTQQAADMLNVSRPHLVKILEAGEIRFKKVGTHRRIDLKDMIAYGSKVKQNRKGKLNFLARQAQKLKLGY
ncbi:MAG: excisionase family DNA-binding protein [Ginsengibacter sp.]